MHSTAVWSCLQIRLIIAGSIEVCLSTYPVPQRLKVPPLASCFACTVGEAPVDYGRFGEAFTCEPEGGRRMRSGLIWREFC